MTLKDYINALKRHDWHFEYSDHRATYERGRNERVALRQAQRELDPLGTLWNEYAPADYRIVPN